MIMQRLTGLTFRIRNSLFKSNVLSQRLFSENGHNDFKPKLKTNPDGLDDVLKLIDSQVKQNDVMLYMKGTPSAPQCGFSMQAVRILNAVGVEFGSINVLQHSSIREGIKQYSWVSLFLILYILNYVFFREWPTIPQIFVKGEFLGGCDILTAMHNDGSLVSKLKEHKLIKGD